MTTIVRAFAELDCLLAERDRLLDLQIDHQALWERNQELRVENRMLGGKA